MPGFKQNFVEKIHQRLYCPLCHLAMKDPVQITTCGHRFCDSCLQEYLGAGIFKCPEDNSMLDYAKIYPDPEVQNDVMAMMVRCVHYKDGCRWVDKLNNLQSHLEVCRYDAISCPNECSAMLSRLCLEDHLEYTCPRRKVTCESCGKDFSGEAMETHQSNCPVEIVWCENKCGARLQRRYLSNHARNECHKRTSPCPHCKKEFVFETLQNHFYQCPRFPVTCPNRCDSAKVAREDIEIHLMERCPSATIACIFKHVGCKHVCPRYSLERHLEDSTRTHLTLMCDLAFTQEQRILSLTNQLRSLTQVHDGRFIWKISNYAAKFAESKTSNNLELNSEFFYTSRYGYKLGASVFLNGNGSGEGTHLSLYIRVLRGEYDNLLEWPFRLPIAFRILDQCSDPEKRAHLVESFVPNPSWKHFQKPSADAEAMGFGYPKFVSQETLKNGGYIKDDAIFVKITVDSSKFILP